MSSYARIDPVLHAWAKANGVKVQTSFAGRDARFCYWSSPQGECFQIVVKPELFGGVQVDAWTVETADDRDPHRRWSVPLVRLGETLDRALSEIKAWASPTRYLENVLALFMPETGLDLEQCARFIERIRVNPDTRQADALRRELASLYADPDTDWVALLAPFEVCDGVDQTQARAFVTQRIWNPLFPHEPR